MTGEYRESLHDIFSIRRKVSDQTEKHSFHSHEQYEIVYAISDNLICRTMLGDVNIPAGCCVLLDRNLVHHIDSVPDSGACVRYVLYFDPAFISVLLTGYDILLSCFQRIPHHLPPVIEIDSARRPRFDQLLSVTEESYLQEKELERSKRDLPETERAALMTRLLFGLLLLMVDDCYREQYQLQKQAVRRQSHSDIAWQIQEYIDCHFDEKLTIDAVANRFFIGRSLVSRVFRETYHQTFSDRVRASRIGQAQKMLVNTSRPIEMISQEVGYGSNSAFTRAFAAEVGMTPVQYRKSMQEGKKRERVIEPCGAECPYARSDREGNPSVERCPNFASCGCRFRKTV